MVNVSQNEFALKKYTLVNLSNVQFLKMNMSNYLLQSNLSDFWHTILDSKASIMGNFISDLVRIILLYDFGGVYLDTDTITRKPIPTEWPTFISNGERLP